MSALEKLPLLAAIAMGGALGALGRHTVSWASLRWFGPGFPVGTMAVNISGAFAMGFFIEYLARRSGVSNELRAFVTIGMLGAFTTFSTYALDIYVLFENKNYLPAAFYLSGSVVLAIAALVAGLALGRAVL